MSAASQPLDPLPGPDLSDRAKAAYLDFLLRRFQGHEPDFQELLREQPGLREDLGTLDGRWRPLLQEYLEPSVPAGLAEKLEELSHAPEHKAEAEADAEVDPVEAQSEARLTAAQLDEEPLVGSRRYTFIEEVARGGMGVIHRVWDKQLRRPLAMKVILSEGLTPRRKDRLLRRFLREAQISGQLDHPGVVPVHEVGIDSEERVFFTMRLVRGRDLRTILREAHAEGTGWNPMRALGVILKVCETMEYAHSKGVIHRDLKPANIMVGNYGEVYIMDWGLARVLDDDPDEETVELDPEQEKHPDDLVAPLETEFGAVLGTPVFMAPEQAQGKRELVGPWSDVYSLGAILYTYLAQHPPYLDPGGSSSHSSVLDRVREEAPSPLMSMRDELPSELISICERAMARELEDRYSSIQELHADLRAYHESELKAAEDARRAAEEAVRDQKVAEFLIGMFEVLDPDEALGDPLTAREFLDRGAHKIENELQDQPVVQGRLFDALGGIYHKVGLYDNACQLLERAVAVRRGIYGDGNEHVAQSLNNLAQVYVDMGNLDTAEELYREALTVMRQCYGPEHVRVAGILHNQAILAHNRGEYETGVGLFREALSMLRTLAGDSDPRVAKTLGDLAWLLQSMGNFEEAEPLYREALDIYRDAYGEEHPEIAIVMNHLGAALQAIGRYDEAEKMYVEVLSYRRKILGNNHPTVAVSINNLAVLMRLRGNYEEAERLYRETIRIYEDRLGPEHPNYAISLNNLAVLLSARGEHQESDRLHEQSLEKCRKIFVDPHPLEAMNLSNMARNRLATGRVDQATRCNRDADTLLRRFFGDRHPHFAKNTSDWAAILLEQGDLDGAQEQILKALSIQREKLTRDHPDLATTLLRQGRIASERGQWTEAEDLLREAHEMHRRIYPDGHPVAVESARQLDEIRQRRS